MSKLLFISHDFRDRQIAGALVHAVNTVTAGSVRIFSASDATARSSVAYGEEWFAETIKHLKTATEFVSIVTKNSVTRPWIAFEAGLAKGRDNGKLPVTALLVQVGSDILIGHPLAHYKFVSTKIDEVAGLLSNICVRADLNPPKDLIQFAANTFVETISRIEDLTISNEELQAIYCYRETLSEFKTFVGYLKCLDEEACAHEQQIINHIAGTYGFAPEMAHSRHVLFALTKANLVNLPQGRITLTSLGRQVVYNIANRENHPSPAKGELEAYREVFPRMNLAFQILRCLNTEGRINFDILCGNIRDENISMPKQNILKAIRASVDSLIRSKILVQTTNLDIDFTSQGKFLALDLFRRM